MFTRFTEAGKKIAKRNATRLKAAMAALAEILAEDGEETGAEEVTEAARDLVEAMLRQSDNVDARREAVRQAIKAKLVDPMRPDQYVYVWIRDLFDAAAVYSDDNALYQIPYTMDTTQDPPQVILGEPFEVELAYVAKQKPLAESDQELELAFVPLVEKAVRRDGTIGLKLIDAGWGSSGYYSKEVLKRDGPKVLTAGTKMFANHYTATEEAERPEGKIEDLVATLTSNARWEDAGADGPGLYADAKVYENWRGVVDDLAEDIGISIRGYGKVKQGEAEGRTGPIVETLVSARSVDFVTDAGRGGKILSLREAANKRQTGSTAPAGSANTSMEEENMPLSEAEQQRLQTLEESNKTLTNALTNLLESNVRRDARDKAIAILAGINLPEASRSRLAEAAAGSVVIKDGAFDAAALEESVRKAAKTEGEYLVSVGVAVPGIKGMGETLQESARDEEEGGEDFAAQLAEAFEGIGLSESVAKQAAQGRN